MTIPELRSLSPSDWRALQAARLAALLDSPQAFASTYREESSLVERQWLERFDGATWLAAFDDGRPVALGGLIEPTAPDDEARYIEAVWVAPEHRRRGLFRSLVTRLLEIGRSAHLDSVFLWVMSDNEVALRAYTRAGFRPTGTEQPLENGDGRVERRLKYDL